MSCSQSRLFSLFGCGVPPQGAPEQKKVRVADIPLVTQVPLYVALDRGYFRDEGLDVELISTRCTSDAVVMVATNQVELGGFGPDPAVFNAMEQGIGIKMLASAAVFATGTRASGLVVRQELIDSGQYHRQPTKGKRIAVSAAQSQFYVELTLARDGLQAANVSFTKLANADMVAALTNGAVDAAWEVEPLIGAIQSQHVGTLIATGLEALPGGIPWMRSKARDSRRRPDDADRLHAGVCSRDARLLSCIQSERRGTLTGPGFPAAHSLVHDSAALEHTGMHTVDPNGALDLAILDRYQQYYLDTGNQLRRVDLSEYVDLAPLSAAVAEAPVRSGITIIEDYQLDPVKCAP